MSSPLSLNDPVFPKQPIMRRVVIAVSLIIVTVGFGIRIPSKSSLSVSTQQQEQQQPHSKNITVYHIHSMSYPSIDPMNMNVGDLAGDVFFDVLYGQILKLECLNNTVGFCKTFNRKHSTNDEEYDLVVTKLVLEVNGSYGPYARCLVCTHEEDADKYCTEGDYVCQCPSGFSLFPKPCLNPSIGRAKLTSLFGSHGFNRYCNLVGNNENETFLQYLSASVGDSSFIDSTSRTLSTAASGNDDNDVSRSNVLCNMRDAADHISGYWYSPLDIGYEQGTWRTVQMVKRVSRDCHMESFYDAVEGFAATTKDCFHACRDDAMIQQKRNTSSPCWLECFLDTLLGSVADDTNTREGGMTKEEIVSAWSRPFDSSNSTIGGCPDYNKVPHDI